MRQFSESLRGENWTGFDGRPVADVVALGIGGSHLGPQLVCDALSHPAAASPRMGAAQATDGYFSHGYGMKAKGRGGASTAVLRMKTSRG